MSTAKSELPPSEPIAAVEDAIMETVDAQEHHDESAKYKTESDEKVTLGHYLVSCFMERLSVDDVARRLSYCLRLDYMVSGYLYMEVMG